MIRTWKFKINGIPYQADCVELHTALHYVAEQWEKVNMRKIPEHMSIELISVVRG
jgi:hypothetical protein